LQNRAFYEKMWKNIAERGGPQMTIWRMRIHAGYIKLQMYSGCVTIIAFPLQQWLHERALMLRYAYIACLVVIPLLLLTANNVQRTRE
jgi:hypothetical protein